MSWKNKANQHHGHKKVIHMPEAQAKKILTRYHKPEAQAKEIEMLMAIPQIPSLALQACMNIKPNIFSFACASGLY